MGAFPSFPHTLPHKGMAFASREESVQKRGGLHAHATPTGASSQVSYQDPSLLHEHLVETHIERAGK